MSDNQDKQNKDRNIKDDKVYEVKVPKGHCIKELSPDEWKTYWKHDPNQQRL